MKPSWLEVVCPGEWDIHTVEEKGQLIGVLPVRVRNKWGFHIATTPYLTPHSGPWHRGPEARIGLIRSLTDYDYSHLTLDDRQKDPLPWMPDFNLTLQPTFILECATPEQVAVQMQKKLRQQLRQAEGRFTRILLDPQRFTGLVEQSFRHQQSTMPFTMDLLERVANYLERHRCGGLWGAVNEDGALITGALYYEDQHTLYTVLSGQDYRLNPHLSHKWLHQELLKYGISKGKRIHFMGSKIPGIAYWNSYFGAEISNYYQVKRIRNRIVRNVSRFVPASLISR
ncbi:MAG: GNAT family N-acetyltransferase [Saprospiraceae bacterium]|nr:GNAT family N-acetyltransferase [Saprospiraceae bacterium]